MINIIPEFIRKFVREKYEACWVPFICLCKSFKSPKKPWPWIWLMLLYIFAMIFPIGHIVYDWKTPESWYSIFLDKSFISSVVFVFLVVILTFSAVWNESEMRFRRIVDKHKSRYKQFIKRRNDYKIREGVLRTEMANFVSEGVDEKSQIDKEFGLQQFSMWVLNSIDTMKTDAWTDCQLHLAINTPLLHSFYWPGKHDGRCMKEYTTVDHTDLTLDTLDKEQLADLCWSGFFCGPLVNKINAYTYDTLDFHHLSLHPVWLRQSTRWFPFKKRVDFDTYKKEIENYKHGVAGALNKDLSDVDTLFQETDMLPFWIAVIRGKSNGKKVGKVVLALTGPKDLGRIIKPDNGQYVDQMESIDDFKDFAKSIADNVVVLKSNDINIVKFFDQVYNNLILHDYDRTRLFRELLREGQHHGLDMMFKVAYDALEHKNIVHEDNIKYVVYSAKN